MNKETLNKFVGKKVEAEVWNDERQGTFFVTGMLHDDFAESGEQGMPLEETDFTIEGDDAAITLTSSRVRNIKVLKSMSASDDPIRKRIEAYEKRVVPVAKAFQEGMKKLDDKTGWKLNG